MLRTQFLVLAAIAATCSHGLALGSTTEAPDFTDHTKEVLSHMLNHKLESKYYTSDDFDVDFNNAAMVYN